MQQLRHEVALRAHRGVEQLPLPPNHLRQVIVVVRHARPPGVRPPSRRGSTWILGPGPAPSGRCPASTPATSSSPTVAATIGRGSTVPSAYASIVAARPGEADSTPTAVTSLSASVRVSTVLGAPARPT